ncbi:MAG: ABC transporter ATP-binding protein [Cycloclasticus sp. symbiont of Poecilosclerida sp. M]|nr:MAG: ABC transporter ATP-binding protein [Cycloclasticus sp. symbiont of Poecilosclerida sp. M]
MTTLIEVNKLSRQFGEHCVVDDVSFFLKKGEVLGFLGPNGAGKSTTMKMICGTLAPTLGSVKINGYDMLEQPKLAKAELGCLPEIPPLYPELTVDEFLHYCAKLHGVSKPSLKQAVDHGKEKCALTEVGDRLIGNLSKGFQQRVGIAQAILHNPSVVVLDEPTVGLDPMQIMEIRQLIRDLGKEHSVILSTHILSEVQQSCSRVQIIHQGKLVLSEGIDDLTARMTSSTLKVQLRQPPELADLQAINAVTEVDLLGDQHFRLHHLPEHKLAEEFAELAVKNHWGLLHLNEEKHSMEEIFISLTKDTEINE